MDFLVSLGEDPDDPEHPAPWQLSSSFVHLASVFFGSTRNPDFVSDIKPLSSAMNDSVPHQVALENTPAP